MVPGAGGGARLNHGVSIGHLGVRMALCDDPSDFLPSGAGGYSVDTEEEISAIRAHIRRGLNEGALGVGMGIQYAPGATRQEVLSHHLRSRPTGTRLALRHQPAKGEE
jgi:hypothetical protein